MIIVIKIEIRGRGVKIDRFCYFIILGGFIGVNYSLLYNI